jgi:hypothetical protein
VDIVNFFYDSFVQFLKVGLDLWMIFILIRHP